MLVPIAALAGVASVLALVAWPSRVEVGPDGAPPYLARGGRPRTRPLRIARRRPWRSRVAASAIAEPRLRVALEAAAGEDESELERALDDLREL